MFRWAVGRDLLTDDSSRRWCRKGEGVKRPPEPDRQVEVLNREEERHLLAVADPQTRFVADLFLASGMRRGEGLELLWSQVDRHGGAILINKTKTGKARSIPLNARLTGVLDRVTKHVRSDFVLSDREGRPLDPYVVTRAIESAMERADIPKAPGAVFNLLRHTFGSRLAEAGVDMTTLATIMGNSPEICYRHYIRFSPGHLKAAMAKVDQAVGVAQDEAHSIMGRKSRAADSEEVVVP
jgi:integrase